MAGREAKKVGSSTFVMSNNCFPLGVIDGTCEWDVTPSERSKRNAKHRMLRIERIRAARFAFIHRAGVQTGKSHEWGGVVVQSLYPEP